MTDCQQVRVECRHCWMSTSAIFRCKTGMLIVALLFKEIAVPKLTEHGIKGLVQVCAIRTSISKNHAPG